MLHRVPCITRSYTHWLPEPLTGRIYTRIPREEMATDSFGCTGTYSGFRIFFFSILHIVVFHDHERDGVACDT